MAQISVKTDRVLLIRAIKSALKDIPANIKKYDEDFKQYEKDIKAWTASFDYSPNNIKSNDVQMDNDNNVYRNIVVLKKYPASKPTPPKKPRIYGYSQHLAIDELKRVLCMLELSTKDDVLSSVSNRVADYIY